MALAQRERSAAIDITPSLARMGLANAGAVSTVPLTGGVSSRILLVTAGERRFFYKQALARLAVAEEWLAPVERNRSEVAWIEEANRILPGVAPTILGVDEEGLAFAMAYLDIEQHPVWKGELLSGRRTGAAAIAAGRVLSTLHGATAGQEDVAERFSNGEQFRALRIEPFVLALARRHQAVGDRMLDVAARLQGARIALVHGDYSPKNILVGGDRGIVVLDAECATYGDPAFDYAFCLSHLLLKTRAPGTSTGGIGDAIAGFIDAYRHGVFWEPIEQLERRATSLLPVLMLARVDGKSPVDYLSEADRSATRSFALARIRAAAMDDHLESLIGDWAGVAA